MCSPSLHTPHLGRQEPAWCSALHSLSPWQLYSTHCMTRFGAECTNVENARNQIRAEKLRTWQEDSTSQWESHCLVRVCS